MRLTGSHRPPSPIEVRGEKAPEWWRRPYAHAQAHIRQRRHAHTRAGTPTRIMRPGTQAGTRSRVMRVRCAHTQARASKKQIETGARSRYAPCVCYGVSDTTCLRDPFTHTTNWCPFRENVHQAAPLLTGGQQPPALHSENRACEGRAQRAIQSATCASAKPAVLDALPIIRWPYLGKSKRLAVRFISMRDHQRQPPAARRRSGTLHVGEIRLSPVEPMRLRAIAPRRRQQALEDRCRA